MSSKIVPDREIAEMARTAGAADALKCYQCGLCAAVCPWYQVDSVAFPVYQVPQSVRMGAMIASEDTAELEREVADVYRCVGCEACVTHCPQGVDLPKVMRSIRRILVQYDNYPSELRASIAKIPTEGNPFGEPRDKRPQVAEKMGASKFVSSMEYLLFRCCVGAYDPVARPAAQSIIRVLQKAGASFGVLGAEE